MDKAKKALRLLKDAHKDFIGSDERLRATFKKLRRKVKEATKSLPSDSKQQKLCARVQDFQAKVLERAPVSALKKRDEKSAKKGVKFSETVETHILGERSWNDFKNGRHYTKGSYTQEEVKALLNSLCSFASQQVGPLNVLTLLCSKSKSELPKELFGAWPKIAESLPERTVQSCHNLCRRRFNPENYGGKWSADEESQLRTLVAEKGTAWKEVAQLFNSTNPSSRKRTSGNIKDKWKQMGAESAVKRLVGPWSL